jgi:hypothetical protein
MELPALCSAIGQFWVGLLYWDEIQFEKDSLVKFKLIGNFFFIPGTTELHNQWLQELFSRELVQFWCIFVRVLLAVVYHTLYLGHKLLCKLGEGYSIDCTVLLEQVNFSCEKLPHAG